jgi:hypothetical protein
VFEHTLSFNKLGYQNLELIDPMGRNVDKKRKEADQNNIVVKLLNHNKSSR